MIDSIFKTRKNKGDGIMIEGNVKRKLIFKT